MCSINLANKFNLKENIILNLIKIHLLVVAYASPLVIANALVVYIYRLTIVSEMLSAQVIKLRGLLFCKQCA